MPFETVALLTVLFVTPSHTMLNDTIDNIWQN